MSISYATGAQLVLRYDVRTLGQLASDTGVAVSPGAVAGDPVILAHLAQASGDIEAALLQGQRYTLTDLANVAADTAGAIYGNSNSFLARLCCDLAFASLWARRPWMKDNEEYALKAREASNAELDRMRRGERVLAIQAVAEAAVPLITGPTRVQARELNMIVDQCRGGGRYGYYPVRQTPNNR